ncbi:LytTR family transcriptional regulator DNA-binding domain-containing protein [Maribellus maritimus]|uniref:LytTR family transcriptional regulator DNA-binding domain-containing protein n=1 Tax=Maribellus maritimus TaxID=2870838 RepID=UPI001EEBFC48|nr:LytTR family transcriptional regulator DNA-binding domain-containing protein [Maribellus maritimus]MCG6187519.1 LytTR family transcriptional regulator DNA-binding domain-containing protein [Maribellus maritimus]
MEFDVWHLWVLAAIVFFILEIFIPSFLMASIGIGCIFAFFGAVFNAPVALQIILFIIGTVAGFVGVKPLMMKYAYRKKVIKTNAGGLVGRIGKVIEEIDELKNTGCVAIDGDQWKSIPVSGEVISVGEKVRVISIDSIVITVELLEKSHPQKDPEVEIPLKKESERLALKVGNKTFYIGFDDIAFLYSANKITYVVTTAGKQYIHDKSLDSLNEFLPDEMFYRANRQFILTRNVISEIKPENNGKLRVSLNVSNGFPNRISVSRLKAAAFREWLKEE